MRSYLERHILPYFENKKLQKINARMIEQWVLGLREKTGRTGEPLSNVTINHCLICLKIMLKEAVRLEYLYRNPAASVLKLKETPQEKSTLKPDQVRELFRDESIDEVWNGDLKHFTLNLLAASTGMRLGECQALQLQHVHREGHISIVHSWDPKYGLVEPKWGSVRDIPVPRKTLRYIGELIGVSPFQGPADLVFFDNERDKPIRGEIVLKASYYALENIGISPEERAN
jgi:integrase